MTEDEKPPSRELRPDLFVNESEFHSPDVQPHAHVLKVEPMTAALTPYVLARSSHHLFSMARAYDSEKDAWLIRLYLFSAAIELGLKASILGEDCTSGNKKMLKAAGHDLLRLNTLFETTFGISLFDGDDLTSLNQINPHFKSKGLEYFTLPVMGIMLRAGKGLPTVEAMQAAASKVDLFLEGKKFIIEGKSSQRGRGIISFV